jgi:hypothetical protein
MSKIKMRCTTCGKWFQSANAKEVTCPDCVQKARKEKLAAKNASSKTPGQAAQGTANLSRPSPPPPPKPKPAPGSTSHWFDKVEDIKVGEPEQPQRPKLPPSPAPRDTRGEPERFGNRGPGGYRDERGPGIYHEGVNRGPASYRPSGPSIAGGIGQRPRQPMEGGLGHGPRPGVFGEPRSDGRKGGRPARANGPKPATATRPKREKIPPPAPFVPTPEQIAQVEARYVELAIPAEFDGIRTQIAKELSIPKKAVKKIVKDLRDRQDIPSWWEIQSYKGDAEELEKIKAAYEPYLPLPPVGVHKTIAEQLEIKPGVIYQAIKAIRLEMNLPQFNDPALHGLELAPKKKKEPAAAQEAEPAASQEEHAGVTSSTATTAGETTPAEPVAVQEAEPAASQEEHVGITSSTATTADETSPAEPVAVQEAEPTASQEEHVGITSSTATTADESTPVATTADTPAEPAGATTVVDSNDPQE